MQGNTYLVYFILLYSAMKVPAGQIPAPDFYRNQLHFGYGINLQIQWQAISQFGQSLGCP